MSIKNNNINPQSFIESFNEDIEKKNHFLRVKTAKTGKTVELKIVQLNFLQRILRNFGLVYRNTYRKEDSKALKKALSSRLIFAQKATDFKKIIEVADKALNLTLDVAKKEGDPLEKEFNGLKVPLEVQSVKLDENGKAEYITRFQKTRDIIKANEQSLNSIREEGILVKIKGEKEKNSANRKHLSIHIFENDYVISSNLLVGKGGSKHVKLGYDYNSTTFVANASLKLKKELSDEYEAALEEFKKELDCVTDLNKKDNAPILALDSSYNVNYIGNNGEERFKTTMPLADGDLTSLDLATLSPEQKIDITSQMLEILVFLSGQGICHRDIKPANLLYTKGSDGKIKIFITDFGFATKVNTSVGLVGTLEFLDPIYVYHRNNTPQANHMWDLYSMGRSLTYLFKHDDSTPEFVKNLIAEMTYCNKEVFKGASEWFQVYGMSPPNDFKKYRNSSNLSRMSLEDIKAIFDEAEYEKRSVKQAAVEGQVIV